MGNPAKRLDTASAATLASMVVNEACISEAGWAFKFYFDRARTGEPIGQEDATVRRALFRDGLLQVMACFTTNSKKRDEFLLPSEAFAGVEGWEEFYKWMLGLRNSYAAHNFGTMRTVEPVVVIHPATSEVQGVGHLSAHAFPPGVDAEESVMSFCKSALQHVRARILEIEVQLLSEASALSKDALKKLPAARNVIPGREDLRTGRKKYRAKTKDFRPGT
jgi:hypothetical protein